MILVRILRRPWLIRMIQTVKCTTCSLLLYNTTDKERCVKLYAVLSYCHYVATILKLSERIIFITFLSALFYQLLITVIVNRIVIAMTQNS